MTDKEHFIMESKMFSDYSTNIKDWKPSKIKGPLTIKSLLEYIHSLEKQIDKMKCCYNCKHSESDNRSLTICDECFKLCYWEMKE